ncbi:MAG: hypothetical protein NT151_08190 [Acidobacteria bacterium]|nr:hypothetical protein [Acidobacteriota bacterium]
MRMRRAATAVVLLAVGVNLRAQETAGPRPSTFQQEELSVAERRTAINGALARVSDPTMRSVVSGPTPTFLLEAGATSKTAAARVGFQYRDLLLDLKLQGLVDSNSGQAVLADLGGLRNKSTAEFGVLWASYPRSIPLRLLEAACANYESTSRQALAPARCTMPELRAAKREAMSGAPGEPAEPLVDSVLRLLEPRRLFLAGLSYKVGPERFTFAPTLSAAGASESRMNWSVSARAGLVTGPTLSIGAEYLHEVDHDAAEIRHICVPVDGADILECSDKVVGAPTGRHREIARVELRKFLGSRLAVNPRFSVNMASGTIGFDVPLYFLQSGKGGLAGGVTVGWRRSRTDGHTLEVQAFVGQVFGLILK